MNEPLANYEEERALFQQLLDRENRDRILMFYGESGSGKSHLLRHCLTQVPEDMGYLSVQLRGSDTNMAYLLSRMGRRLGWDRLHHFTREAAALSGSPDSHDNRIWQHHMESHLQGLLQTDDMNQRRQRRKLLTDAWFADVHAFRTPFLLALDTYEQAATELDDWFTHQFLPWVTEIESLRILVAGQKVPPENSDWEYCCVRHELRGVVDAQAWLPVAEEMGYQVPSMDYLAGACAMAQGKPEEILKFIALLPKTSQPRQPLQKILVDRSTLKQGLIDHFDEEDLHEICFELNLDSETVFMAGKTKRTQVMALIEYVEKRQRYQELVALCQEMRPKLAW